MVRVYADGVPVYAPVLDGYELLGLTATINVEKAGTAEIIMPPGHPAYNSFVSHKTEITIYRHGVLVFRGRVLYPADNFYGQRTIICEGERGFLQDSTMRAYTYKNAAASTIFTAAITAHNGQVDVFKQFEVGEITVDSTIGEFKNEQAEKVSDTIDKLVKECGGYITFATNAAGQRVINWLAELNSRSGQIVEFGENLLDYSSTGANTELATAIIPYGAKVRNKYIDVTSVNGGSDIVQDDEAVALRGFICRPVYFDKVTNTSVLLTRAKEYLATSKLITTTLELSAVDLSAMDKDIDTFTPGDWVRVRSAPHGVDDDYPLRERSYDFLEPARDTVVLGKDVVTLTGSDVAGDRLNLYDLQTTQQTIQSDYTQAIVDAGGTIGDESLAAAIRTEMAETYASKVNTSGQYMTHDGLLLQWGTLTVLGSATVDYTYSYATEPTVVTTPAIVDTTVHVSTGTVDGFTVATAASETVTVHWLAIGKSA